MAGPTHCTKLKVYRPKTCGVVPRPSDKSKFNDRPHTSGGKEKMGPMDLAICWDYRPVDPRDEPKRPTHIDGSNGSAAPAVFTLVKTPRTPDATAEPNTGRSGGVFSNTLGEETFFDKDIMRRNYQFGSKPDLVRTCTCGTSAASWGNANEKEDRPRSISRHKDQNNSRQRRCKSSPNLSQLANASETMSVYEDNNRVHQCTKHKQQRREHSSRTRKCTKTMRPNRLCEQNVAPVSFSVQPKPEYKSAFKAGIPNSNSSGTCTSFDSGCSSMSSTSCSSKSMLKVPKPRNPYSKKDYVIDTLAPPFACWRGGAGQGGYPEHYRLASVYQHAYKPVEQRKRPLLATVYQ